VWASTDEYADAWTAQFLGSEATLATLPDFFPATSWQFLQASAPPASFEPPRAEVLEDSTHDGRRTVRVRLRSPRGASVLQLGIERGDGLLACRLNGQTLDLGGDALTGQEKWLVLRYWGLKERGAELTFESKAGWPITIRAVDQSYGLSSFDHPYAARAPGMMPVQFGFGLTDMTLVGTTLRY
jgi:hypothetical protein